MRSILLLLSIFNATAGRVHFNAEVFACFIYHPSRFLERSGTHSEGRLPNVTMCLERCMEASSLYNFVCRSVMWKKDINFCILSIYDRTQKASRFRVAVKSDIDLYENICTSMKINEPEDLSSIWFKSDMDIVRTTMRVPVIKDVTQKPRILPIKKTKSETPLRRIREQPPLATHKRQGMGPTPGPVLYDSPPVRKFYKRNLELHAKTFSAPLAQPDIIVDTQIDDDGRSLFNLPAAGWKLPPIRQNGASARRFYSKTVTLPRRVVRTTLKPPAQGFPSHDNKVLKRPKKQTTTTFEAKALVKSSEPPPKPCFVRTRQRFLPGFEEKVLMRIDLRTCLEDCLNATIFYCASVNYNENEKICTLNGGNVHLNDAQLTRSTSTDYYENECSPGPQSDPKGNTSITSYSTTIERCFEVFPNSMLLNLDSSLLETPISLELCQEECLRRADIKGRSCVALNWIPHTKGCMLFEDGYDKQLIMPSFHTQFLVNKCTEGVKDRTDTGGGLPPTTDEDFNLNAEGIA